MSQLMLINSDDLTGLVPITGDLWGNRWATKSFLMKVWAEETCGPEVLKAGQDEVLKAGQDEALL